jgi:translation initiation factor 3 subunit I
MRPIILHGHERSLTRIKYNKDGDLLFSASKDHKPNVWFSHNGERLGAYGGHNGTVWDFDVDESTQRLLTGAADNTFKIWDVETGRCLNTIKTSTAVRSCGISLGTRECFIVTDARMGHPCELSTYDMRQLIEGKSDKSKITTAVWGPLNQTIYAGHEDGEISIYDPYHGKKILSNKLEHEGQINDIRWGPYMGYFITSSKDHSAKLFNRIDLTCLKTYKTNRPVNSASISPIKEHVILGGGQEASQVTTTSARAGKFEVRFFHKIYEEEIGRVKGHFGPINTVAFHPKGDSFSSGGEDGYIRIHYFDPDYFEFDY